MNRKNKQITLYVSDTDKKKIENAAQIKDVTISKYILDLSIKQASIDVAQHEIILLGNKERDAILNLLDNPPLPNETLIKLMN